MWGDNRRAKRPPNPEHDPTKEGTNMSRLPETGPSLLRRIRQNERAAQRQQQSSAFALSGTSVVAENMTEVDGTLNVVGNLAVTGPASLSGDTTIGGNAAITGTLSLPSGIIDDAALANPTAFGANGATAGAFALSTVSTAKASATIPIPAGFTRALVHATVNASVENTSAAFDYLFVRANISSPVGGGAGGEAFTGLTPGGYDTAAASAVTDISGLTPGSITVSCLVRAGGGAWAAAGTNSANADATVTFLK